MLSVRNQVIRVNEGGRSLAGVRAGQPEVQFKQAEPSGCQWVLAWSDLGLPGCKGEPRKANTRKFHELGGPSLLVAHYR